LSPFSIGAGSLVYSIDVKVGLEYEQKSYIDDFLLSHSLSLNQYDLHLGLFIGIGKERGK